MTKAAELWRDVVYAVGNLIMLAMFIFVVLLCTPFIFVIGGLVVVWDAWVGAFNSVADMFPGTFKKGWVSR